LRHIVTLRHEHGDYPVLVLYSIHLSLKPKSLNVIQIDGQNRREKATLAMTIPELIFWEKLVMVFMPMRECPVPEAVEIGLPFHGK